jgi:hypothetical protein
MPWLAGLPDFSWYDIPKREKYTKWRKNMPMTKLFQMAKKIYQMTKNIPNDEKYTNWQKNTPNGRKIHKHHPLPDPQKFTQIWIFGLKIYHLATLLAWRRGAVKIASASGRKDPGLNPAKV